MSNQENYQPETPWQKVGTERQGFDSVKDALEAAKLDWKIELRHLYYPKKTDEGAPMVFKKVPNRKAVVRLDDESYLGTVGGVYEPKQNEDIFGVLDLAVEEFGVTIATAGQFLDGRRVWMQAKLPQSIEIIDGDTVDPYFLLASGHDGGMPFSGRDTDIRVACMNSLMAALRGTPAAFVLRHTRTRAEQLDEISRQIRDMFARVTARAEVFRHLAGVKLAEDTQRQYVDDVLEIMPGEEISSVMARRRERIFQLITGGRGNDRAPNSAWAAFNAVTEYTDHVRPAEVKGAAQLKANESALFGANARLKQRAFDIITELAA